MHKCKDRSTPIEGCKLCKIENPLMIRNKGRMLVHTRETVEKPCCEIWEGTCWRKPKIGRDNKPIILWEN